MGQVTVTIAGRVYRMACGDGEEARLEGLAHDLDQKISEMRVAFGEIGDQRLIVMSAIAVADELNETRQRLATALAELKEVRSEATEGRDQSSAWSERMADGLERTSEQIERIVRSMNSQGRD